jgi:SAM-dependent methyltransferase
MNKHSYFTLRGIKAWDYKDFTLPSYIKRFLTDPEIRVLDIGCGYGQFLQAMKDHGLKNLRGIDVDEEAVACCRDKGLSVEKIDDINRFSEMEKGSFDLILMNHILEHIEKGNIIPTLKSVREMLSPGGKLFISVPNAQSPTGCYWAFEDFTHTTIFTAGSLLYVLRAAGFDQMDLVDPLCLDGLPRWKRIIKRPMLSLYSLVKNLINIVAGSSYHKPSPRVWSYEVKMTAWVESPQGNLHGGCKRRE